MLEQIYTQLCRNPSDINEHLPTLKKYAELCSHITEFGLKEGEGRTTHALLMGKPKKLISYDIKDCRTAQQIRNLATKNGTDFQFIKNDVLTISIEPTDLLFIDTIGTYNQLSQELSRHSPNVRKYIIIHDTVVYGDIDEFPNIKSVKHGLKQAIHDFLLINNNWSILETYTNNHGLTILGKDKDEKKHITPIEIIGVSPKKISVETYIVCHDQDIILKCERDNKYINLGDYKYVFVGNKPTDKIHNNSKIIISRNLPINIEEFPHLYAFTAWYSLCKNNLIKSDIVTLFEYDISILNSPLNNINKIHNENNVIGYLPYLMLNSFTDKIYIGNVFNVIKEIYNVDVENIINEKIRNNKQEKWLCTSNITISKEEIYSFVSWFEKLMPHIINDKMAGHIFERCITFYCLANNKSYSFIENVIRHNNLNSHKSLKIDVSKLSFKLLENEGKDDKIQAYFKASNKKHIAIYDTWPDINNGEKEVLKRFEIACDTINVGFLTITNEGIINNEHPLKNVNIESIDTKYIDCVISLHYHSPKNTKHYTLMTLWNPLNFYLTKSDFDNAHKSDGYISCYSDVVDNHFTTNSDKKIVGHINHTLCKPILDLTCDRYKCFYIGINWERVNPHIKMNGGRKKILDLLKKLDGNVNIYGPKYLIGNNVWGGYNSYIGEIPFDGVSIVNEINKCGICLVLSSESHIKYEICSSRLFEGLAAGVPIICDRNPFIQKWFGDNVFYISYEDTDKTVQEIQQHIKYIKNNKKDVMRKLKNCRKIFEENFALDKQLNTLLLNVQKHKTKVLVTGGAGMIGSNLVKRLVNEGNNVFVVDNLFKGNLNNLYIDGKSIINIDTNYFNVDLTVPDVLDKIIIEKNIEVVIHLAYVIGGISYIFNNEGLIFRKNIMINSNVINSVRTCSFIVKSFINIGSACSFPQKLQNSLQSKLKETDLFPADPESAYGWTKIMGCYETDLLRKETNVKTCNLIFHNVYGSPTGYNANAQVIPSLIYKVIMCPDGKTIDVWGSGNQGRAFVYVDDAVDSIVKAMSLGVGNGNIQIGPDVCTTIKEIVDIIIKKSGKNIKINYDTTKPEGDKGRSADYTKAYKVLGWKPNTSISEGIGKVYDWIYKQTKK